MWSRTKLMTATILTIWLISSCVSCNPHGDLSSNVTRAAFNLTRMALLVVTPFPTGTPPPTVVEPGLAYGTPCKPPCWWGLIPGKSTSQEATQAMEQLRASGWADHIAGSGEGMYSVSPSQFTERGRTFVIIDDDLVVAIQGDITLFYYPLGSLIKQFGPPEGIHSASGICSSCQDWKPPNPPDAIVNYTMVDLIYPTQGLWFSVRVPLGGSGCLCPEMPVDSFCYYPPVSMSQALNNNYLVKDTCWYVMDGVTEKDIIEWHGFGGGY